MKHKWRILFVSWFILWVFITFGNVLFHGVLAVNILEGETIGIARDHAFSQTPPGLVGFSALIAHLNLTIFTIFFILRGYNPRHKYRDAAFIGGIVGYLADGTWNLLNILVLPKWTLTFALTDGSWHILHGALAGILFVFVYERAKKRWNK